MRAIVSVFMALQMVTMEVSTKATRKVTTPATTKVTTEATPKPVSVGISDFQSLLEQNYHFVDKTEFIKNATETGIRVYFVTRPHGFGKTINLSMLRDFFNIDQNSKKNFKRLKISNHKAFCSRHRNKYSVVYFSLKNPHSHLTEAQVISDLRLNFANLYREYGHVMDDLNKADKKYYHDVVDAKNLSLDHLEYALAHLVRWNSRSHDVKTILIIDDLDSPIAHAIPSGSITTVLAFLKGMLFYSLKDTETYVKQAFLASTTQPFYPSQFPGVHHLLSDSMLQPEFPESFGFTGSEVESLLNSSRKPIPEEEFWKMYGGYGIGGERIYNPFSVVSAINRVKIGTYWRDITSIEVIESFLRRKNSEAFSFRLLLNGKSVKKPVDDFVSYEKLTDESGTAFWSYLVATGYVDAVFSEKTDSRSGVPVKWYNLKITNPEVKKALIQAEMLKTSDLESVYDLYNSFKAGPEIGVFQQFFGFFEDAPPYYNFEGNATSQNYYDFFLERLGLLDENLYTVKSDPGDGEGTFAIGIVPKDPSARGIFFEFKRAPDSRADAMRGAAREAVDKALDKEYLTKFLDRRKGQVEVFGVSFFKKDLATNYTTILDCDNYNGANQSYIFAGYENRFIVQEL